MCHKLNCGAGFIYYNNAWICRVCRKWRRVCEKGLLWNVIDIPPQFATNRFIAKILKGYASPYCKVLRIRFYHPNGQFGNKMLCSTIFQLQLLAYCCVLSTTFSAYLLSISFCELCFHSGLFKSMLYIFSILLHDDVYFQIKLLIFFKIFVQFWILNILNLAWQLCFLIVSIFRMSQRK